MKIYQFKGKCNISGSAIRRERERQRLTGTTGGRGMQAEGIQPNQKGDQPDQKQVGGWYGL